MSRHHANTQNPKIIKMQQDYALLKDAFGKENPYLLGLIERARTTKPLGNRRFGYMEAEYTMRLFRETGYIATLHTDDDMQDPLVFWKMLETAKDIQRKEKTDRAIRGLVFLYENLDKKKTLDERFMNAEKTPYNFIRRNSFVRRLCAEEYKDSSEIFIVDYNRSHLPIMVFLPYRNEILRRMVIDSVKRDASRYKLNQSEFKEIFRMEELFGPYADRIKSPMDLNTDMLNYAKDSIMKQFAGNLKKRMELMKLLWSLFRHAVMKYPDKNFFADSYLWNSTLIINHRVPFFIARGYIPVLMESSGSIPPYKKLMYIITNGEYHGASGKTYGYYCLDNSKIRTELYRWLVANYIPSKDMRKHAIVASFLIWLEDIKEKPGHSNPYIDRITANELASYKNVIALKTRNGASRNVYIGTLTTFIRWAAETKKIRIQQNVFRYFDTFNIKTRPNPSSLTTVNKSVIEASLLELAEKDPRFLLTLNIFRITLRSDIRTGQLCSLDLSRMTWKEDGTSEYYSRVKNRGVTMVKTYFTKTVTKLLREAETLTEDIRKGCPIDGPRTQLYIYKGIRSVDADVNVMTIQRYNKDLRAACEHANLEKHITSGNVRDTRQTAVAKFARNHNLDDMQIATLTKHKLRSSLNSYSDMHIEDLLEEAEKISLGSVKPAEAEEDNDKDKEGRVC